MTTDKSTSKKRRVKKKHHRTESIDPTSERSRFQSHDLSHKSSRKTMVELDMLIGNEWRHWIVSAAQANALIQHYTHHRGYLITPIT